ncbi:MAG TPA: TIGR03862 family flavoprotein [Candidatus Saccharimonadia bacterium]|nr:TIGR03862 family flavoprotein [Candidatus Saccharimonadia bacterium]
MSENPRIAVVGGGPAGLMAAEAAIAAGAAVDLYESRGSVGRKLLIAGRGGLNLTHAEPFDRFVMRYGERARIVAGWLREFDAGALRDWARGLGIETFVGSSGRVFPADLKSAPLLRHWVTRLRAQGVRFHVRHRWTGCSADGALRFEGDDGEGLRPDATVLALGGASWPQLGSDGAWVSWLQDRGVGVAPLEPSNCGFDAAWSPHFAARHAGHPLKSIAASVAGETAPALQGECVVTATGVEGQLVYALSARLRDAIARDGTATLVLDLAPGRSRDQIAIQLAGPRGSRSRSEHWRRRVHIDGAKAGLLLEHLPKDAWDDGARVAATIKSLPLTLLRPRPIAEAISSAGGIRFDALTDDLMLRAVPGSFCAGEMLDWEAPTGGYLLAACFASGRRAGAAAARWAQEAVKEHEDDSANV